MRAIYESVVYLFVVHPYDVGDAVLVGPNQDWCNVSPSSCNHLLGFLVRGVDARSRDATVTLDRDDMNFSMVLGFRVLGCCI